MTARDRGQSPLPGLGGSARVARVRRYVDRQLRAQRSTGMLEPVDDGLIGVAMTLADALDAEWLDPDGSRFTVGALAGRLVPVLLELRGQPRDTAGDVDYDAELAALVAAIRNVPRPGPPDAR